MTKEFNFKIGADPEFCIVVQNSRLHASNAIPHLITDKYRIKEKGMGFDIPSAGNIGWDGCSSTGEIRPNPSNDPQKVVNNIAKLFKAITFKTQMFSLITTSQLETVGGHIHLEINHAIANDAREMNQIHARMATLFLPVLMGENSINLKKRLKDGYGNINDWRINNIKEDQCSYEFRCPTAEWLTTPKLTQATLSYMGVIFHEIINKTANLANIKKILLRNKEQAEAIQKLTIANFLPLIMSLNKSIRSAVRTFEMYPMFKEEVEYIFNFKKILRDKERVKYDIMNGWNLNVSKKPNKRELTSGIQLSNRLADKDIETLENAITIRQSKDYNIELFARALKQRILAFNWKLKNKYTLFGLRRGLNLPLATNANNEYLLGQEMIQTRSDLNCANELMERILLKHGSPKNHTAKERENEILFGIPYKDRIDTNPNIKEFIKNIYDIERNKYSPQLISASILPETINDTPGRIAKIMKTEPQNQIDTGIRELTKFETETPDQDDDNADNC